MVCWNAGKPPIKKPGIALGISANRAVPVVVGVTLLFGKVVSVAAPGFVAGQSGNAVCVKVVVVCPVGIAGQRSLKSPVRSASEGTFGVVDTLDEGAEEVLLSFRHSSEKKKNVFFLSEL